VVCSDLSYNAGDGGSDQTVLIETALLGLLMDKTGLREREGYGAPTPELKYIHAWTLDVYAVLG
jgi:hypothetical protein